MTPHDQSPTNDDGKNTAETTVATLTTNMLDAVDSLPCLDPEERRRLTAAANWLSLALTEADGARSRATEEARDRGEQIRHLDKALDAAHDERRKTEDERDRAKLELAECQRALLQLGEWHRAAQTELDSLRTRKKRCDHAEAKVLAAAELAAAMLGLLKRGSP